MKIGTFLLEMLLVLATIFCLYYMFFNKSKASITNDQGKLITEDVKSILNETSKISADPYDKDNNKEAKDDVSKKVNKLMKKYNIK